MGKHVNKAKKSKTIINGKYYPLVSVCTPTFNRRPFILNMIECFKNQTYPKERIEWIIVDDGTDKIKDIIEKANIPQIRYYELPKKVSLGEKRNIMHSYVKGSIIVYMDDDDYYPPDRISHAVDKLTEHKEAMCAGSSEIYIYFKELKRMVQCGPYGPNHATAGTFAFRAELLKETRYENHAALAEEKAFLKNYTVPFVQLDPMKTILVFSHNHNTFDKRKMLENPHPDYLKDSRKTVDDFIKFPHEQPIKDFFMKHIDGLLTNYKDGEPSSKPDVLKQIKELEAERQNMINQGGFGGGGAKIMMNRPGLPPIELMPQDMINILQQQQVQLDQFQKRIKEQDELINDQENTIQKLKKLLKENLTKSGSSSSSSVTSDVNTPKPIIKNDSLKSDNTSISDILNSQNTSYVVPPIPPVTEIFNQIKEDSKSTPIMVFNIAD